MTSQAPSFDLLIVGSGPSGVQAAVEATAHGAKVGLVDIGGTDDRYDSLIPGKSFTDLRQNDPGQQQYLLGDPEAALANLTRAGAHLTPPRQYMVRDMDQLFPLESQSFFPLQSTSAGGLGISWGANVYTLEDFELQRVGLPVEELKACYEKVAADVGVSGPTDSFGKFLADISCRQPPLSLDTNARSILGNYQRAEDKHAKKGFRLGQAALAVLSQNLGDRQANQYTDMDFYGDVGFSVYRPQFTLQTLRSLSNFTYLTRLQAISFEDANDDGIRLKCRNLQTGNEEILTARRLVLAAGAINSGKLALRSLPQFGNRLPILCNPNHWIAAINLAMLGRPADDPRYSLAQLTALQRAPGNMQDYVLAQFYSYRSLLYFRMLRTIPLPPRLGVTFLRLISTALTCVNLHFSDSVADSKWIELKQQGGREVFSAHYEPTPEQARTIRQGERLMLRRLLSIRCLPMGIARPAHGASIHYAGTLPASETDQPFRCDPNGRLYRTRNVYVADGSSWKFLPAKGLTFTLMANARRVAAKALENLQQ